MTMKQHKGKNIERRSHTLHTTLCGRMSGRVADGMNIAETDAKVTCKFCLRAMAAAGKVKA